MFFQIFVLRQLPVVNLIGIGLQGEIYRKFWLTLIKQLVNISFWYCKKKNKKKKQQKQNPKYSRFLSRQNNTFSIKTSLQNPFSPN